MSTYSTSYKQTNPKSNYPKAPFTPVNQAQTPNQTQPQTGGYQQQAPNQQQNQAQQPNQRQMYMPQQHVAAVLTHQPPPQPPPSQPQSNQPGQNTVASRGIPPPPQPQQTQNYQAQNSNSQNQSAPQQQQQQTPNPVYIQQQAFNPELYQNSYQARGIPFPIQGAPQNYMVHLNPLYLNQNHPQAAHFEAPHVQNVPQTHPQPFMAQGAQGMYPAPPFIYQPGQYFHPAQLAQQPAQIHRANISQPTPPSTQTQSAPAAQTPNNQITPNSQPAQQTDNLSQPQPVIPGHTIPHFTPVNPPIIPAVPVPPQVAYAPYPAYNQLPPQQPQPYQKREKKPLLIVDPNTKQPINKNLAPSTTAQPQTTTPVTKTTEATPSQKPEKKEEKQPEEPKKTSSTTSADIQAQVLRNIREQQQNKVETEPERPKVEEISLTKPVSKQVTVSVQEKQQEKQVTQPQITQPISYSSAIAKPTPVQPVKNDDNNNKKLEESTPIEKINEKLEEVKLEPEPVVAPVVVVVEEKKPELEVEPKEQEVEKVEEKINEKRRYDREFLLSLQNSKLSIQIPDHLKDLEIFQELKTRSGQQQGSYSGKGSYSGYNQGEQQYGKGSMSKKNMGKYSMNKYNKGSMEGGRGSQTGPLTISLSQAEVALNRVENPYQVRKPSTEHEELIREVRNILNKLTPQNLQKLTRDLINLPINTEDRLKDSIHVIFEKCLDEQVFSATYAELCRILASIRVPLNADTSKYINFRTMLLTKCQKEFDSDYAQSVNYEKLIEEANAITDEAKQKEAKELAEEKLIKAKRRSLGNIRFIGELFKLQMLTEGIMNDCIERLLKQETDEENLECLCKLLTTIGKELDRPNNVNRMKSYFEKLGKIAQKKEAISSRIRFMILDVIDLRKNNWVPRRKDQGPKKIDDIRKEAEEEQARIEAEIAKNQQLEQNRRQQGQKGGKYQQNMAKSTSMDSEAFHRSHKPQNGSMVNKIKDVKKNLNTEMTLGPGGGAGYGWNKPKPTQETVIPQSASFSAQKRVSEPVSRLSMDSKSVKPDRVQAVKRMDSGDYSRSDSSQASSRDNSQTRVSKKTYTEDEVERKADNLLNELVENKNLIESIKDLEEFNPSDSLQYVDFIEKLIMTTLERNESARTLLGQFLYLALKEKKLETSHLEQGLKRVIEISDDMSIDIPKISSYLSQIIAPLFNENLSVEFLRNALEPVKEIKLCADIISEALNRASDRLGHSTISDIFRASNLQLNEFLQGIDDSKEYINQHKLQWVTVEKSRERTTSSSVSIDQIENKLNQIFTSSVENKVIFDKIEKEYSPNECSSKPFIRALVIAVCNSCYNQNKFDADLFKKRVPILNKYIAKKEDLELESLFAIQTLDNRLKHQPGYMRIIFDLMYDEDIVREDVFLTWRTEDREEGHGICVLSLKAFFDWLTDADNDTNEA